jgi:hypothetical protein
MNNDFHEWNYGIICDFKVLRRCVDVLAVKLAICGALPRLIFPGDTPQTVCFWRVVGYHVATVEELKYIYKQGFM